MEQFIEFFKLAGPWAAGLLGAWIILNLIGEALDKTGKLVPAFMKIRTCIKKRKQAKQEREQLLIDVKTLLADVNAHYSEDNISKRNEWMNWVNQRAKVYDASVQDLVTLHKSVDKNNSLTIKMYIDQCRTRINDFSGQVLRNDRPFTREEFRRVFDLYEEYELILKENHLTNGQVEVSMKLIREDYERRTREGAFLEDSH